MEPRVTVDDLMRRRLDRALAQIMIGRRQGAALERDLRALVLARTQGERVTEQTMKAIIGRARQAFSAGRELQNAAPNQKIPSGRLPINPSLVQERRFIYGAEVTFATARGGVLKRYFEVSFDRNVTKQEVLDALQAGSSVYKVLEGSPKSADKNVRGVMDYKIVAVFRGR